MATPTKPPPLDPVTAQAIAVCLPAGLVTMTPEQFGDHCRAARVVDGRLAAWRLRACLEEIVAQSEARAAAWDDR